MEKCAGLGCSTYDYLKMLVETDTLDTKQTKETEEKSKLLDRNETQEQTKQQTRTIGISKQLLDEINRTIEETNRGLEESGAANEQDADEQSRGIRVTKSEAEEINRIIQEATKFICLKQRSSMTKSSLHFKLL
jgi:methyl-accepting chemotaxis protein